MAVHILRIDGYAWPPQTQQAENARWVSRWLNTTVVPLTEKPSLNGDKHLVRPSVTQLDVREI